MFTPICGEIIQFDEFFFQMGWDHQLVWLFDIIQSYWWAITLSYLYTLCISMYIFWLYYVVRWTTILYIMLCHSTFDWYIYIRIYIYTESYHHVIHLILSDAIRQLYYVLYHAVVFTACYKMIMPVDTITSDLPFNDSVLCYILLLTLGFCTQTYILIVQS